MATVERDGWRISSGRAYLAWGGIALGVLAFWLTVPPVTARSPFVPIVLGGLGRGRRLDGAAARGLPQARVGRGRASGCSGSSWAGWRPARRSTSLEQAFVWSALIAATLRAATPLTFAALGGIFSERSGVVNIGLEGMLLMGAFFGFLGADKLGAWYWGLVAGIVAGAALALVHAFISIHLRADQIVSGTAVNFLALGITGYFFIDVYTDQGTPGDVDFTPTVDLPWVPEDSFVDKAFGDMNILIWVALVLVLVSHFVLFHTPVGLRLRSVGEHPKAADTVGISVYGVALRSRRALRRARRHGRRIPLERHHARLQREHDRSARLHRTRGRDFRAVAAVRRIRRLPPLRVHGGACPAPAQRVRIRRRLDDALPRVALRRDARRRGRRRRTLDPAGRRRPALRQAMTAMELPRARNPRASASLVVGVAAIAIVPLAIAASQYFDELTLVQSCASAASRRRSGSSRSSSPAAVARRRSGRSGGAGERALRALDAGSG